MDVTENIIIKAIYNDGPEGLEFSVYHDGFSRYLLLKWCEEQFGKEKPVMYDYEWRWNWLAPPRSGTPLTIFKFQYKEDAMAFKLRWS